MDSVDIREWIRDFADRYDLSNIQIDNLLSTFEYLQDGTDSALKIIVPLLLAYCNRDQLYPGTDRYLIAQISEDRRLKITLNIPASDLDIQVVTSDARLIA